MNKVRLIIAFIIVAALIGVTPMVVAESSESSSTDSSTTTNTSTMERANLQKRIDAIKLKLILNLTAAQKAHLKSKCRPAQILVKKVHTRFGTSVTTRTQAYTVLTKNLNNLVTKLKAKSVDTTELETELTILDGKVTTYQTDLADYKQKLSDLKDLDCQADPTAFEASLEASRTARDKLLKDILGIRTYVKETIKPTLQKIKTLLEESNASTNTN